MEVEVEEELPVVDVEDTDGVGDGTAPSPLSLPLSAPLPSARATISCLRAACRAAMWVVAAELWAIKESVIRTTRERSVRMRPAFPAAQRIMLMDERVE